MRIAVVSDIHGNLPALEAVVRDFSRRGVDAVVNLGDSLSGPMLPLETAQFLMAQAWTHLAGNHERQILSPQAALRSPADEFALARLSARELGWMATLHPTAAYSDEVLLCHGTPASDREYFLETVEPGGARLANAQEVAARCGMATAALILCGHTHMPRMTRSKAGQLIVNPGSVGLPAFDDDRPYPHVIETGSPDARYAIVERTAAGWLAELIGVPYDFQAMAELARIRNMPQWERALLSGYMA